MRKLFVKMLKDDQSGAAAIEYGLIAGLVSIATVTALTSMGTNLNTLFTSVNTALSGVGGA
jgi:pilus assembly protein Flp/PilA